MGVIHSNLKLFPYKLQILEAQSQANTNQRYEFCQTGFAWSLEVFESLGKVTGSKHSAKRPQKP